MEFILKPEIFRIQLSYLHGQRDGKYRHPYCIRRDLMLFSQKDPEFHTFFYQENCKPESVNLFQKPF